MQINNDIPLREKNIVLIGFMGVGKTTIGRHLSDKLYRDFIDIDQEIEKLHGMPVPKIFESMGEQAFRQMEKEFITKLCRTTRLKIISLGGGSFLQEEIKQVCLANSIVFYLDLSWDSWKDRLQLIMDSRPVLQNKSLEEIEKLFYSRQSIYEANNSKVSTDSLDPEEIADHIIDTIKLGWELYDPASDAF
ncbi:shikimate kinase [Paenibacillus sophorae]|uniref:Shikimate kinase n=1 Tax=Paenibacillus sophorae TaxID=1333845 RepID=A0A1H8T4D6_9BACL|nr:shikimate kinase [Paenibacillus sophorae]